MLSRTLRQFTSSLIHVNNAYNKTCCWVKSVNSHNKINSAYGYSTAATKQTEQVIEPHIPVLVEEVIENLAIKENGVYLDFTFGAGGHTKKILKHCDTTQVFGIDRDPTAYAYGLELEKQYPGRFRAFLGKFSEIPQLFSQEGIHSNHFDGVIMDVGVSTMQFSTPERGFMLSQDGPLDMRMDQNRIPGQPTAAEILQTIDEFQLYKVLKYYGQEKRARLIARMLVESRLTFKKLETTQQLAELVSAALGDPVSINKMGSFSHPATRTFQALRVLVNDEFNELDYGVKLAHHYLTPNGILAAISFHSLEDTIIKRHLTGMDIDELPDTIGISSKSYKSKYESRKPAEDIKPWVPSTKHVIATSYHDAKKNPKARSAKLRVASKNANYMYT